MKSDYNELPSLPSDIIADILNGRYRLAREKLLDFYDSYMRAIATTATWDETMGHYVYYLDEDLLEEMRLSLINSIPAFHRQLQDGMKHHL